MKLVDHITIRLSGLFIAILLIWSVIYFILQMNEIRDGIDEGLNNLKQEFIFKANRSPDFVTDMQKHNPLNIIVERITYEEAKDFKEVYTESKVYFVTEEEEEEVRMLTTMFFCEQDSEYYKLKFFTSTVERDDLIKNILYLLLALWLCLGLAMTIIIKKVVTKSNKPFYELLKKLNNFRLDNTKMIELPSSNISEYIELNESVKNLLEENIKAFTEQKNFIENASHEIQTPLAIVIGKIELLMYQEQFNQKQLEEINSILSNLNRMKRLNNNLLLLSKIKNKQFPDKENINISNIFCEVIENFDDLISHKKINTQIERNADIIVEMNRDLAYILVNNLIKNAISHNIEGGNIKLILNTCSIILSNNGTEIGNNIDIFNRYISVSDSSKSSGLGLSIVKSIADIYHWKIDHLYFDHKHTITLKLSLY